MKELAAVFLVLAIVAFLPLRTFGTGNGCENAVPSFIGSKDGIMVFRMKLPISGHAPQVANLVVPSKAPTVEILFGEELNHVLRKGHRTVRPSSWT